MHPVNSYEHIGEHQLVHIDCYPIQANCTGELDENNDEGGDGINGGGIAAAATQKTSHRFPYSNLRLLHNSKC